MGDTKLEDYGSVEVEIWNGEMGVKYGEVVWTPVVRRRKKSARSEESEESESSGNLNVNNKRSLVRYNKVMGSREFIS